jgi:hypothetical protein
VPKSDDIIPLCVYSSCVSDWSKQWSINHYWCLTAVVVLFCCENRKEEIRKKGGGAPITCVIHFITHSGLQPVIYRAKRVLYLTRTHMFFQIFFFLFFNLSFYFPLFLFSFTTPLSHFLTYEWILFSINTTVKVDWIEDYLSLGAHLKILARNFLLLSN